MPIKAGFYQMSLQEYHHGIGAFAESKSSLSNILDSARKFKFEKSATPIDIFDLKAKKFNDGTAFHTYFGEPEKFASEISISQKFTGTGSRAFNEAYKQVVREKGLIPITTDTEIMLHDFHTLLHSGEHEEARKIIEHPDRFVEYSGFWRDYETGIWLKTRPDNLAIDVVVWDLKKHTTPKPFKNQAIDLHYDLQLYMALVGCSILTGVEHTEGGYIVFHAREKPYDIEVVRADWDFIESGRDKFETALSLLAECRDNDKWPGKYKDEIGTLSPADWRLRQMEMKKRY